MSRPEFAPWEESRDTFQAELCAACPEVTPRELAEATRLADEHAARMVQAYASQPAGARSLLPEREAV